MFIIYCGLRHFYVSQIKNQIPTPETDAYFILTHNKETWDFSPELKTLGFASQEKPVLTLPIDIDDFTSYAEKWHEFAKQYTEELEVEYPHAWYMLIKEQTVFEQFIIDFQKKLQQEKQGGIWGAGQSKLIAKLAAHHLKQNSKIISPQQRDIFLNQIPISRLALAESATLEKLGIKTIGELARIPLTELSSHFGQRAISLHKLGLGEDLIPFRAKQDDKLCWILDCTTLDDFLRPLTIHELLPYLKQGIQKLACTLNEQYKIAGQIKLKAHLSQGTYFEKSRELKTATADPKALNRLVKGIFPQGVFSKIEIELSKFTIAKAAQLNIFQKPWIPELLNDEILNYAQHGVDIPRRELLLMLWKGYFT